MSKDPVANLAEKQAWIAPVETGLQKVVDAAFNALGDAAPAVDNFLHGTWLNEPLHAVLTDIPVGAWTAAMVFDSLGAMSGESTLNKAADAAVAVGLVGAAGAAVTGMTDWSKTEGAPRRIGAVHALLNVAATGLYVGSCVARCRRSRSAARSLAGLGYALMAISAHLGGNLVYEHGVGVQDRGLSR